MLQLNAINRFANDINVGTFNKLLVSLLCYDDILTLTNHLKQVLFKSVGINRFYCFVP